MPVGRAVCRIYASIIIFIFITGGVSVLKSMGQFFRNRMQIEDESVADAQSVDVAAAALLIEVGRADFHFSDEEETHALDCLRESLQLDEACLQELLAVAREQSEQATSLHGFTRLVHDHYSTVQKRDLMEKLWRIALLDGRIDRYEDYILRKISELIYLSHQDFIQAKLRAMGEE